MNRFEKILRFIWRFSRNLLCVAPIGRRMLFPQDRLAASFGRGDAEYAWRVFYHHYNLLRDAGFYSAERILEVGSGRNLGTALLWWAYCGIKSDTPVEIVCWDVFKNAAPEAGDFWGNLARELLDAQPADGGLQEPEINQVRLRLREVAEGHLRPPINYRVEALRELERVMKANHVQFDLIYSQAVVEHIWHIETFWDAMFWLTHSGGWHSHRIDLADHGRRDSNYIEMLEWSQPAYWLTMRFIPGAINRWRAGNHASYLRKLGFEIPREERQLRARLPLPRDALAEPYRSMDETELRTTAVDIIARLPS